MNPFYPLREFCQKQRRSLMSVDRLQDVVNIYSNLLDVCSAPMSKNHCTQSHSSSTDVCIDNETEVKKGTV